MIPKNREYVESFLTKFGLSSNNTFGIIRICKGLSLNDSYWVVEDGFEGKFENYNLYQNKFSRTLALIAYTEHGSNIARGFTSSPEFTTNGILKKCWQRVDGKIYLYKGGTMDAANTGKEPYSEFYAAQIAQTMGIKHVEYNLKQWKGVLSVKAFAPVFDNGLSLFNLAMEDDLADIANYSKTCKPALGGSYEDVAKEFMSERQRAMLRKMINFKFVPHSRDNLPKTRLKKIEKFLGQRVYELLEL